MSSAGGGRAERVRVAATVAGGQRVEGDERARGGRPGRLQHHRLVDVAAVRRRPPASSGRSEKCPAPRSSSRPNSEGESNRGAHSQSTEPSRLTSAARVTVGQEGVVGDRDTHRLLLDRNVGYVDVRATGAVTGVTPVHP